jgi:hypothetical protein
MTRATARTPPTPQTRTPRKTGMMIGGREEKKKLEKKKGKERYLSGTWWVSSLELYRILSSS